MEELVDDYVEPVEFDYGDGVDDPHYVVTGCEVDSN